MRERSKYVWMIVFPIWLSGMSLQGCGEKKQHKPELPTFEVTTPIRQDTEITRRYVCQIRAIQHIEVRALERGYLENIFVDEGHHVTKGEHLFQILPVVYRAELARSTAEAEFADVEYRNKSAWPKNSQTCT